MSVAPRTTKTQPGQLLTLRDVATRLQVSQRSIYRLLDRGLPAVRVGSVFRFSWPAVLAYLDREANHGR
jgi:excisionase family DNA binding protein